MGSIYEHATCTIAATSAVNGGIGLFHDRKRKPLPPVQVEGMWQTCSEDDDDFDLSFPSAGLFLFGRPTDSRRDIDAAPLNTRAWVFQERYLSPRLLHFTDEVVYWECEELFANEMYPSGIPTWAQGRKESDMRNLKSLSRHRRALNFAQATGSFDTSDITTATRDDELYNAWKSLRRAYTACNLTFETDIFVAFLGILQEIETCYLSNDMRIRNRKIPIQESFPAGLLASRIHEELCWSHPHQQSSTTLSRPKSWRAPSWSWASTLHEIEPTARETLKPGMRDVIQMSGKVIDIRVECNRSGQLTSAVLLLKCRIISALLRVCDWNSSTFDAEMDFHGEMPLTDGSRIVVVMDEPMSEEIRNNGRDVLAAVVFHCRNNIRISWVEGLVIERSSAQVGAYQRIGRFHARDQNGRGFGLQRLWPRYKQASAQVIEII